VIILVSTSFAWLLMFFNFFTNIFSVYINSNSTVYGGYFLFLGFAAFSALVGSVLSERTNRTKFLISWIVIGIFANISLIFTQEFELAHFYLISAVLGISIGLGFPSCLAYLADCTAVEERARISGMAVLVTFIIAILSWVVAYASNFGIGLFILLSTLKGTSLFAFVSGNCKRQKSEKIRSWRNVFTSKDFVLYLFPWLMFSVGGSLIVLVFSALPGDIYADAVLYGLVLHYLTWAVFGLISGITADRIGRRQPMGIGMISLGVSFAILGIATNPITYVVYQTLSGVAWGFLFTVYITILGDLSSYGSKEKFYAMGAIMPIILTLSFNSLIEPFGISASSSILSPILSIVLFLSILPVLRATETLPGRKIRDRELKEHIEKIGKLIEESKKEK
jgi:MFS family permease